MLRISNYCGVQLILAATELEDAQAGSLAGEVGPDAPAVVQHNCEMLCNNQPASGGHCFHVALEFPPKNAISQTRDDVEWAQLWNGHSPQVWTGLRGYIQPKLSWCCGAGWVLWWHCSGTGGKEDGLWQPPAAVGPPCILQHGNRDGGTPEGVPVRCPSSIQEIVLRGALKPAALPFGLRSSAGTGSSSVCWGCRRGFQFQGCVWNKAQHRP